MTLATQSTTQRRRLLACCAGDPASPMSTAQKTAVLSRLLDPHWAPMALNTPVPFSLVEAWYHDLQQKGVSL